MVAKGAPAGIRLGRDEGRVPQLRPIPYDSNMPTGRITADPAIMAGAPIVRGTRITVSAILSQLATGIKIEDLLADFPSLERDDVLAALAAA